MELRERPMNFCEFLRISMHCIQRRLFLAGGIAALSFLVAFAAYGWTNPTAAPPNGNPNPPLQLQSSTPGTQQTGHMNISGTGLFGGNVGIGTTGPVEKLTIAGNIGFTTGSLLDSQTTLGSGQNDLIISAPDYLQLKGGYETHIYAGGKERVRIANNGNVGIGTTNPNDKLEVAGFTRTYGLKTSVMTTGAEMVYIRGTGLNHSANRLVKIGNTTHVDSQARGLNLCIITASTHALVGCTTYDTYGSSIDSNNLATALNNLTRDQIGILTSFDAWEGQVTTSLRTAARRLGLFKLGAYSAGGARRPYAAIFYGSGTTTGNTEPGRQAIEVMESNDADAPYAIITTWLTEDGFGASGLPNALVSADSTTVEPALIVDSSGNVGIGTTAPNNKIDIVSGPARTGTHPTGLGLYVTDDSGSASGGVEFRHYNGSQGIGFGYNTIYATGSNTNQDLNLQPRGTGLIGVLGDLKITGSRIYNSSGYGIVQTNAIDWLRINPDSNYPAIALYNPVAIGTGGLAIGEWSQQSSGVLKVTQSAYLATSAGNVGIGTTGPGYKLDVASGGASTARFGTASTDKIVVGGGSGKIDAGTVDPVYTIGGKRYATYMTGMTGVKEETTGIVRLARISSRGDGNLLSAEIDFGKVATGSDLWLFYQITDFGANWEHLAVLLTPNFDGEVWYAKDPPAKTLTIYAKPHAITAELSHYEVSYRLTAPRFDHEKWPNTSSDSIEGMIVPPKE